MLLLALLAAAEPVAADRLSLFAPLVGSCWRTQFSAVITDTHCFEAVYGGAHVRDRHEVQEAGKTIYAGETIYSDDGAELEFTYVNSLGGVGHGTVQPKGAAMGFSGSMRASPDKKSEPIDSEWRVLDSNHYQVRSLVKSASAPEKPLTFTRVK